MARDRLIYLRVDEVRKLDHWCRLLSSAFHGAQVAIVGSVLSTSDWRDVDVRVHIPNVAYDTLPIDPLDLNMLLSHWGQRVTDGLPIDCQVQSSKEWASHQGPVNVRVWRQL